ncbi:MAG: DNA ligase [Thiotrichales bacterium]
MSRLQPSASDAIRTLATLRVTRHAKLGRLAGWLTASVLLWPFLAAAMPITLARVYTDGVAIEGFWMSEKLDGIRAIWDGQVLRTRGGQRIAAPQGFTDGWPDFPLDGELWTRRGDYQNIARIVLDHSPSDDWRQVSFHVFDAPLPGLTFAERLARIERWFNERPSRHARIIEQRECPSRAALAEFLAAIEAGGGEGVMLRDPAAIFEPGRSATLLKVKSHDDAEATVIGYRPGKGKYTGQVGSLEVEMDGVRFFLGSGLRDVDRSDPPPIGSRVTFRYNGLTDSGKPRFPRFLRRRQD